MRAELTTEPGVQSAAKISVDRRGGGIDEDGGAEHGASLLVQVTNHGKGYDADGNGHELVATADEAREQDGVSRGTEHVSMHLLPAVLVSQVLLLQVSRRKSSISERTPNHLDDIRLQ